MKKLLILSSIMIILSSCGFHKVETGEIAIKTGSFSGKIESTYATQGLYFAPLTDHLIVDATDVRFEFNDLTPKDSNNIKFRDVDLTIPIKLNPKKAVEFYIKTKEVDVLKQNEVSTNVLGYRKITNKLNSVIIKAFSKFEYQLFINNRDLLENEIRKLAQEAVDFIEPETFIVGTVDTTTINLDPEVELALQDKAIIGMKQKLMLDREVLLMKELALQEKELTQLKVIASKSGISVESLMNYRIQNEKNSVLSKLAKSNANVQVQVKP